MTNPETITVTVQIPKFNQISGERADSDWYREVTIPAATSDEDLLEKVFELGQNDFQPQECPSVSVGNVIHNPRTQTLHLVAPMGFTEITDRVYAVWTAMNVYAVQSYSYKS